MSHSNYVERFLFATKLHNLLCEILEGKRADRGNEITNSLISCYEMLYSKYADIKFLMRNFQYKRKVFKDLQFFQLGNFKTSKTLRRPLLECISR